MQPRGRSRGEQLVKCSKMLNTAIYAIEKTYPKNGYYKINKDCDKNILAIRAHLMSLLPHGLINTLAAERSCKPLYSDPSIKLLVLQTPNLTVYRSSERENVISLQFWRRFLPTLTNLVILDLKFLCSDEILEVIGTHCLKLHEINIMSSVGYFKAFYTRVVTDAGLKYVANLKKLRKLFMDRPRNERHTKLRNRPGVSQLGIVMLLSSLPCLLELNIMNFDLGTNIVNTNIVLGPLNLQKIIYHFPTREGIRKLIKICPNLRKISVSNRSGNIPDEVVDEISLSNARINQLDWPVFKFADSVKKFFTVKGWYLTDMCLWDSEHSLTFESLLCIGTCCTNLVTLFFITRSPHLVIPEDYETPAHVFPALKMLTVGNGQFNIENVLNFLLENKNVRELMIKYKGVGASRAKTNVDILMLNLLKRGCLRYINTLWLDSSLEISKDTIMKMIIQCDLLKDLTFNLLGSEKRLIAKYVCDNNYNVKLGWYKRE